MIRIFKLVERVVDPSMSSNVTAEQIKLHVLKVGHGVGNIDFNQCMLEMDDTEYDSIVQNCGEYGKFKLGNLNSYFEIDLFPEHAVKLADQMPNSELKKIFTDLKEGYIVIQKHDEAYPL